MLKRSPSRDASRAQPEVAGEFHNRSDVLVAGGTQRLRKLLHGCALESRWWAITHVTALAHEPGRRDAYCPR
jgi:hypothetical protein